MTSNKQTFFGCLYRLYRSWLLQRDIYNFISLVVVRNDSGADSAKCIGKDKKNLKISLNFHYNRFSSQGTVFFFYSKGRNYFKLYMGKGGGALC